MCLTLAIHRTSCETRRRVILNPFTGQTIFHPVEEPRFCAHSAFASETDCPSHGPCCTLQKWQLCMPGVPSCQGWQTYHQIYSSDLGLLPELPNCQPFSWSQLEPPLAADMPAFTLRRDFFDAGAELWQCVTKGQCIVGDIDAYVQEPETYAYMQIEHLQTHNAYQQAAVKLASLKAIWEVEANHLSIEPCPSVHVDNHPFFPFFQLCDDVNDGFRMLDGFKSFELDAIRMAETFSLPEPQKVDPEDLALTPTTKTKMCLGGNSPESLALIPKADTKMSLDDQSSLLAEIQGLKDRVAVLEFEKLQANTASLNNGFNIQTFTPETTPERVILARPMPGDIVDRHLEYFPEEMDTSIDWNGGSMSSLTVSTPTSPKGTKEPRLSLAQPDQELLSQLDRVIVMDPEHVKFLDGEVNEQYLGALDATWTAGC